MNLELLLRYATIWSLVITAFSVVFAVFSHRRQVNASVYLDLTERLQKLFRSLPAESRAAHLAGGDAKISSEHSIVVVVDFLHLMNAAFTLHRTGYFSGRLWDALGAEAERGLRLPLFREQWPKIRSEFVNNPKFIRYVERVQRT